MIDNFGQYRIFGYNLDRMRPAMVYLDGEGYCLRDELIDLREVSEKEENHPDNYSYGNSTAVCCRQDVKVVSEKAATRDVETFYYGVDGWEVRQEKVSAQVSIFWVFFFGYFLFIFFLHF